MAEARPRRAVSALAAVMLVGSLAGSATGLQGTLVAILPADGAASGWARDGETQIFEGEELYAYIDGGAEIYQEYGFRRVAVQDYRNAAAKIVSLEIFEMDTPAAAFGMFTSKRSGAGKIVSLGSGAELEDYYLNFWKGRFLATLTGFDEFPETIAGLEALAKVLEAKITAEGDEPRLVGSLPAEGLRAGSVRYLKGLLGLNGVYPFYTARGLNFEDAVHGSYDGGAGLLVLRYGSPESRASAWLALSMALEASDRFQGQGQKERGRHLFLDGKGRSVAFAGSGPLLIVGIAPDAAAALEIVERAR